MENITATTPGDILKKIRKELGFKQHELAADDITRNLISLIENNRATLNRGNAEILVKNMNNLCKARGIDIELEFRDLFISGIYDAKSKAKSYMDYIKKATYNNQKISNDKIDEIALFMSKWNLQPQNTYIYELIAKYYLENNDIQTGYSYYIKAFENALKIDKYPMIILNIANRLVDLCAYLERTTDALQIGKIAQAHCFSENMQYMLPIWHKLASISYNSKNYDESFIYLEQLDKSINPFDTAKVVDTNILKTLLYIEIKDHKKATEVLNTTKQLLSSDDEIQDFLRSIEIKILMLKGSKERVKKELSALDKSLFCEKNISPYISDISLNMATAYLYLKNIGKAKEFVHIGLSYALENHDRVSYKKIIEFIYDNETDFIDTLEKLLYKTNKLNVLLTDRDFIVLIRLLNKNKKFELANKLLSDYKL